MRLFYLVLGLSALTGCFNPDLGKTPFKCATEGNKCPEGYTCQEQVCVKDEGAADGSGPKTERRILSDADLLPSKEGPAYIDGASETLNYSSCIDKDSEPNNTKAGATMITREGPSPGWEICPAGDVDQFAVQLEKGQKLTVSITFKNQLGDLELALADPDGFVIGASRGLNDGEQIKLAAAEKKGVYIIGVYGFGKVTNTYDLNVSWE
jgi:hypothetical protein